MSTKDHVAVRLDNETLLRIDAIRALLDTEWRDATRSDVLRLLILKGLEHFEKKHRAELDKRRPAPAPEVSAPAPKRAAPKRGAAAKTTAPAPKPGAAAPKRGAKKKSPPPSA
jgi:hypothetical protein